MIAMSLSTDSLIAFKSSLLTCIGLFFIAFIQLFYKDSRPFWENNKIVNSGHCMFDFGSPSSTLFILTFYYGYCLIMYRFKFASG